MSTRKCAPKESPDITEKEFLSFPDTAADVLNVLLYQGRAVTDEQSLLSGPTETVYQGSGQLRNQYEDLSKYVVKEGHVACMYLIANQSRTDGRMLLRKAGYTGGVYRDQYAGKLSDIFPVIEIVLYWGVPRWRGSRSFRRLFRKQELTEEEWRYIDDLKLQVFEMRHLPQETRELFQSDMRIIVDFLAEGKTYRSDRKVRHKAALVRMIRVLSGDTDVEDTEEQLKKADIREEDEITMCELFDQYIRLGEERGEKRGEECGKKCGEASQLVTDVNKLMTKLSLSLEKACEMFDISISQYEEAQKLSLQE